MTYRPNRLTIGYERSHVLNPWVFADLRQPQRMRGFVSPLVYQTRPPTIYHPNLSGLGAEEVGAQEPATQQAVTQQTLQDEERAIRRAALEIQKQSIRIAKMSAAVGFAGLVISAISVSIAVAQHSANKKNRSGQ